MSAPAQTSVALVTGAGRGFGREIARRLAGRGYAVLVTDTDEQAAEATAAEIGGGAWARALDVRDGAAHREAARDAAEHGRLDVWVNNAGAMRTGKAWEHADADVSLMIDANLYGVVWGSRAAVDAMTAAPGGDKHIVNIASLSALAPVPGLAVYAATKHAVLGFSTSLEGDLRLARRPIRVHALCPDVADTQLVRREEAEDDSAVLWSAPRMLSPQEVADRAVALLDNRRLVDVLPRRRGWQARAIGLMPAAGLRTTNLQRSVGARRRERERRGAG